MPYAPKVQSYQYTAPKKYNYADYSIAPYIPGYPKWRNINLFQKYWYWFMLNELGYCT